MVAVLQREIYVVDVQCSKTWVGEIQYGEWEMFRIVISGSAHYGNTWVRDVQSGTT